MHSGLSEQQLPVQNWKREILKPGENGCTLLCSPFPFRIVDWKIVIAQLWLGSSLSLCWTSTALLQFQVYVCLSSVITWVRGCAAGLPVVWRAIVQCLSWAKNNIKLKADLRCRTELIFIGQHVPSLLAWTLTHLDSFYDCAHLQGGSIKNIWIWLEKEGKRLKHPNVWIWIKQFEI